MDSYQTLFKSGVSQEQVEDIKKALSSNHVRTWEEYYWGTKCIIKYDIGESNPDIIIKSIKKAFRNGLNVQTDSEVYQDALKIISAFYGIEGNYLQVINHLMVYKGSLGDATPAWAYHDIISAQIHTDQIEILLNNPEKFLSDLARNDDSSQAFSEKSKNIFRDFLICAADYISSHNNVKFNAEKLFRAAVEYKLDDSEAWAHFSDVISFRNVSVITKTGNTKPKLDKIPKGNNVVPLFPPAGDNAPVSSVTQDSNTYDAPNSNDELQKTIAELENKLEANQRTIDSLQEEIGENEAKLVNLLDAYKKGTANEELLQNEISSLKKNIQKLNDEKSKVDGDFLTISKHYDVALSKLKLSEKDRAKLQAQVKRLEDMYNALVRKYEDALRQKEELLKYQNPVQVLLTSLSDVDIIGRKYYYLNITCLDVGRVWLKAKLPKLSRNFMSDCFYPGLTSFQLSCAHEYGWTKIDDFDLSAVLKVIKYNFYKIPSFIPTKEDETIIDDMIKIRNDWGAHLRDTQINFQETIDDIYIMSEYVHILGGDEKWVSEMRAFADSLEALA